VSTQLDPLWRSRYPFQYWDNRIEKLNPYNRADRFETLSVFSTLVRWYARVFVSKVRRPDGPWAARAATLDSWTVVKTLEALVHREGDHGFVAVERLLDSCPDDVEYEGPSTDFDADPVDRLSVEVLGCPADVSDSGQVTFDVEPALYRASVDTLLTIRLEFRSLLEAASDGCQVLPLDVLTLESLVGHAAVHRDEKLRALRSAIRDDDGLYVASVNREAHVTDAGPDRPTLTCYRIDVPACHTASNLALAHFRHLFGQQGRTDVEQELFELRFGSAESSTPGTCLLEHLLRLEAPRPRVEVEH